RPRRGRARPRRALRGSPRRVSLPASRIPESGDRAARDELALAVDRAAGARPIGGNRLAHLPDSPLALEAMLDLIATARAWVHLENYIIRDDATGRRGARPGIRSDLAARG